MSAAPTSDTRFLNRENALPLTVLAVVVLLSYAAVVLNVFGALDDYVFLLDGMKNEDFALNLLISAGRPINGCLFALGFRAAGSIEHLVYLRAITLIGIWGLGAAFYLFSLRHGAGRILATALASGIILLPSFQVYAAWAQHFSTPFAGIFAVWAAFLMSPDEALSVRKHFERILGSIVLLVISLLIYHPAAMFYFTALLILMLLEIDRDANRVQGNIVIAVIAGGVALVFGFVALKLGQMAFPNGADRFALTGSISAKIAWFFSQSLYNAFSPFFVLGRPAALITCLVIVSLGAMALLARRGLMIGARIIVLSFALLCLSYTPSLLTGEYWASYRSGAALNASALALVILMATQVGAVVLARVKFAAVVLNPEVIAVAGLAALAFLSLRAQANVQNGFILPNVIELNNFASRLQRAGALDANPPATIEIKASSWADSASKPIAYDEFGIPSSVSPYRAKVLTELVLRSLHVDNPIVAAPAEPRGVTGGAVSVDFSDLVTSQRFRTKR